MTSAARRILLMADVHANSAALEAVLVAAGSFDRCIFLGDIVGYGPQPREAVRLLRTLAAESPTLIIAGNHDRAAVERCTRWHGGAVFSGVDWDDWTAAQLDEDDRVWLAGLRPEAETTVGGSIARVCHFLRPTSSHISDAALREEMDRRAGENDTPLLLFGHYHRWVDACAGATRFINPGSVGQQRDGCPDARFAVWDADGIEFRRVPYDVETTVAALSAVPMTEFYRSTWEINYREGIVDLQREREAACRHGRG